MAASRICIGGLKGPHGLQGWVKVKLLLADATVLQGQSIQQEDGTAYAILGLKAVGQGLVALQLAGITTPEQAAALKGPVYLAKKALAVAEDEVLLTELIGQPLLNIAGVACGTITGITELPAGPALQVALPVNLPNVRPKTALVPINLAFVTLSASTPPVAQLTAWGEQLLSL